MPAHFGILHLILILHFISNLNSFLRYCIFEDFQKHETSHGQKCIIYFQIKYTEKLSTTPSKKFFILKNIICAKFLLYTDEEKLGFDQLILLRQFAKLKTTVQ